MTDDATLATRIRDLEQRAQMPLDDMESVFRRHVQIDHGSGDRGLTAPFDELCLWHVRTGCRWPDEAWNVETSPRYPPDEQ